MTGLWPAHIARDAALLVAAFMLLLWLLLRASSK
jgi:hypothetical protein